MDPMADGSHPDPIALRDPTVVSYNGKFTLYATLVKNDGSTTMEAASFVNWPASGSATVYFMDNSSSFSGSHSAPQLFYVAGQKKWYLLSQATGPAYSTATDPAPSATWTKPTPFFSSTPSIVTQNAGSGPGWTDFWIICDSKNCHMFFGNNNGTVFRSQTSLSSFPNGFAAPVVVMKSSSGSDLYGGVSVYKVKGSTKYLLLVEAVGSWHYIRSWTADALDGSWTALADSESSPFAGLANLSFSTASPWTKDVAEGELVRDGYDETMSINPCSLQYLYQGRNAYTSDPPAKYPWKLALATRTN
jgi:endo-1,4-beta-xylanase